MTSTKVNIAANYFGSGWTALSLYICVPFYIKFLGVENYGLIGFYAVLQSVFAFAYFGMIQTLGREMARLSVRKDAAADFTYSIF